MKKARTIPLLTIGLFAFLGTISSPTLLRSQVMEAQARIDGMT